MFYFIQQDARYSEDVTVFYIKNLSCFSARIKDKR